MTRRIRLPKLHGISQIITVAVVALLLIGAGGYAVSRLRASNTSTMLSPTATPLTIAQKNPPSTPSAMPGLAATPAKATPGNQAQVTSKGACKTSNAKPVSKAPDGLIAPGKAMVSVDALNMRSGPSTDCPIVGSLSYGMQVEIGSELLKDGDYLWRKVKTPEGEGYTIASSYQNLPSTKPTFVEILMYHHISDGNDNLHVPADQFEQQLAWLKDNGYVSITPDELYQALYKGGALPAKPIMLTIDDGNPSTETFKDLLDKYGFRGVYFLPNYAELTEDQIRALDKSGEVCAHTVSHQFLGQLSYDDQQYQIVNNKQWLEKIVGHPVTCFAYPFGSYNTDTDTILTKAGFTIAFNAWGGPSPISSDVDPLHVLRKEIDPVFGIDTFAQIATQGW